MNDEKYTEHQIREFCALHKTTTGTTPELDDRILHNAVKAQKSAKTQPAQTESNIWRPIMKRRITKPALAATIVIIAIVGIYAFTGSVDPAGVAWGDVIRNMQSSNSITWKHVDLTTSPPTTITQFWVLPPYYRYDRPDGTITVEDSSEGTVTFIYPEKNQVIIAPQNVPTEYSTIYDAFVGLKDRQGLVVEPMGRSQIDGKEVVGFYLEHEYDPDNFKDPMHIWVDPKTELPVRLDFLKESGGELVPVAALVDIVFDERLDESLFKPDLAGYEISQAQGVGDFFALHSIENASHVDEPSESNEVDFTATEISGLREKGDLIHFGELDSVENASHMDESAESFEVDYDPRQKED